MTATFDLGDRTPPAPEKAEAFPSAVYALASSYCAGYMQEAARAASSLDPLAIDRAAGILLGAYTRDLGPVLMRQRGVSLHRQPPPMRPFERRPGRHGPGAACRQLEYQR